MSTGSAVSRCEVDSHDSISSRLIDVLTSSRLQHASPVTPCRMSRKFCILSRMKFSEMNTTYLLHLLVFMIFLGFFPGCAQTSYMRVGSLEKVLLQPHTVSVAYGTPSVNIDIMQAWSRGMSHGGFVARSVGRKIDHNRNRGVLDRLIAVGIQDYIRNTISEMMSPLLHTNNNLSIGETFNLPARVTESKQLEEKIPAADELFAVDSNLKFYTYNGQVITYLEITLTLQSRDKPRKTLWQDIYLCELCSTDGNLHENDGRYAKQLIAAAVEVLKTSIQRDLTATAASYNDFPQAQLQTVGGMRIRGQLLGDEGGCVTLRLSKGTTRVMSKQLVRKIRIVASQP